MKILVDKRVGFVMMQPCHTANIDNLALKEQVREFHFAVGHPGLSFCTHQLVLEEAGTQDSAKKRTPPRQDAIHGYATDATCACDHPNRQNCRVALTAGRIQTANGNRRSSVRQVGRGLNGRDAESLLLPIESGSISKFSSQSE